LGPSRNVEGAPWHLPKGEPDNYLGLWADELTNAMQGFVEVAFLLEKDGVDRVKVCVTRPLDTVWVRSLSGEST
jgi:hypothetical protein